MRTMLWITVGLLVDIASLNIKQRAGVIVQDSMQQSFQKECRGLVEWILASGKFNREPCMQLAVDREYVGTVALRP